MTQTIIKTAQLKQVPAIRPGDTVKVHQKIKEGNKERIQVFEGVVIAAKHGVGVSGTITVRKVVDGVGVERIFPIHAPSLAKIEVVSSAKVRRAKLYYLRSMGSKKAKLKKRELIAAIAPVSSDEILGEPKEESRAEVVEETKEVTPETPAQE